MADQVNLHYQAPHLCR